jgi:hypothetical protein
MRGFNPWEITQQYQAGGKPFPYSGKESQMF